MYQESLNTISILRDVGFRRRRENLANVFKALGVLLLAMVVAWLAIIIYGEGQWQAVADATFHIAILVWFVFVSVFLVVQGLIGVFWPILLYFWACVVAVRQRTLLSLVQTALETKTPPPNMIRAYATSCYPWYAVRLQRFADALEAGLSLDEAVRKNWGLFRYDVAGMIRLGGDNPETLRTVEEIAQDERDFSMFRTSQVVRVIYLFGLVGYMMVIIPGMLVWIVPRFEAIFSEFDTELPGLTLVVVLVSDMFVRYWYLLAFPFWLLGMAFLVYLILQTNIVTFRPFGFRRIFRNMDAAKFLMVFSVGIRHRYPIPSILEMYRWTVPSEYLRRKGKKIQTEVEKGRDWIDAVRRAGFVSRAEAALLHTAERTGNTASVLDQLARSKDRSQIREDDLVSKMVFIPLLFVLGAIIGVFAVGMFMPIIKLITSLS